MSERRSKLEIYLDILQIINKGDTKPTRIMYKANLSWISLCEALQSLIINGIISEKVLRRRKEYIITKRGKRALKYFQGITQFIKT